MFSPSLWLALFVLFCSVFLRANFLILIKSNLSIFSCIDHAFDLLYMRSFSKPRPHRFLWFLTSCIVLCYIYVYNLFWVNVLGVRYMYQCSFFGIWMSAVSSPLAGRVICSWNCLCQNLAHSVCVVAYVWMLCPDLLLLCDCPSTVWCCL